MVPVVHPPRVLQSRCVFAWEMFAGSGRLPSALAENGLRSLPPMDTRHGPHMNPMDGRTLHYVCQTISSGQVWYAHFSPPDTGTSSRPKCLSASSRRIPSESCLESIWRIVGACVQRNVAWTMECPTSSGNWWHRLTFALGTLPRVQCVSASARVCVCIHGDSLCTRRRIIGNLPGLISLASPPCAHQNGPLRNIGQRALPAAYPPELARMWANIADAARSWGSACRAAWGPSHLR